MNLTADQIAAAYIDTATVTQEPIYLGHIRNKVDEPREKVDATLLAMVTTGYVHLLPSSHRSRNNPDVAAAGIKIGGENKLLLVIEDEYFSG